VGTLGYSKDLTAAEIIERRAFRFAAFGGFEDGWFKHGRLVVKSGAAGGLSGLVKRDHLDGEMRVIELWHPLRADVRVGDLLRLVAGCDKRAVTCRLKFQNFYNFQGFPDVPGDDWSISDPSRSSSLDGGSRR